MNAMNQSQIKIQQTKLQVEYDSNQQKIADLEARQAKLLQVLSRSNLHQALVGERTIPNYAPWLPFSK